MMKPAMMAVQSPASGLRPLAMAKAIAKGRAQSTELKLIEYASR
jgi:hypothetical protein